jgi:hypothetical protein
VTEEAEMRSTRKDKSSPDRERMRRKAIARWENEGGAGPCGPQVPGGDTDCDDEGTASKGTL